MDVVNHWNINMDTLGADIYQPPKMFSIWGFAVKTDTELQGHIFLEENECMRCWYNAHCEQFYQQVSEIQADSISEMEFDENYLDNFGEQLLLKQRVPVKVAVAIEEKLEKEKKIMTFSLIWNGDAGGNEEDKISATGMKDYGYGLIYNQKMNWYTFFDNRLAAMVHKLRELQQAQIKPICVAVKKENRRPIPVANGRILLQQIIQSEILKDFYEQLQQ